MNGVKEILVTSKNRYLNANKWNSSLNYIELLENIMKQLFGNQFKGIYRNNQKYSKGDCFWLEDKCYCVGDNNENFQNYQLSGYKDVFFFEDTFYALNDQSEFCIIKNGNVTKHGNYELMYKDDKSEELLLYKDRHLFLYNVNTKQISNLQYVFGKKVVSMCMNSLYYYFQLEEENVIYQAPRHNTESTKYETFSAFTNTIVSIYPFQDKLYILTSGNEIEVFSCNTKSQLSVIPLSEVVSIFKSKIVVTDSTIYLYNGTNVLFAYFLENDKKITLDSKFYLSAINYNTKFLRFGSNHRLYINDSTEVSSMLDCRYAISPVDAKYLTREHSVMIFPALTDKIDFKQGIYESKNWKIENKALETIESVGVNAFSKIRHWISENYNKNTILIKFKKCETATITIQPVFKKEFSIVLQGIQYAFLDIINDVIQVTTNNSVEKITDWNFVSEEKNCFTIQGDCVIEEILVFNTVLESYKKYIVLNNTLYTDYIPSLQHALPFSKIKTDEHGNVDLKLADSSIKKTENGYKVSAKSEYTGLSTEEDNDAAFSVSGAKEMYSNINKRLNDLSATSSATGHKHKFKDLLDVPKASQETYGVTQLLTATESTSESYAATPKSIKLVNDKVKEINKLLQSSSGGLACSINNLIKDLEEEKSTRHLEDDKLEAKLNGIVKDYNSEKENFLNKQKGGVVTQPVTITNIEIQKNQITASGNSPVTYILNNDKKIYLRGVPKNDNNGILEISAGTQSVDYGSGINFGYHDVSGFHATCTISSSGDIESKHGLFKGNVNVNENISLKGDLWVTSDKRLKSHIQPIENAKEKLESLHGYSFYKRGFEKRTAGVIAQELNSVFPEAVQTRKDGFLEVDYNGIHALTIECIKELYRKNMELEDTITELQKEIKKGGR